MNNTLEAKVNDMGLIDQVVGFFKGDLNVRIDELMSGEHEFINGYGPKGKRPFSFRVSWGPKETSSFLFPGSGDFMVADLKGVVNIDGMDNNIPCSGKLEFKYIEEQKIRYTFDFKHDDKFYLFIGEKRNIYPWNLPISHTTCYGEVIEKESGTIISKSITHFHMDTLFEFLGSVRLE